jgi:hypothetical protein
MKRYKPIIKEITISSDLGSHPELPLKKWQAPIPEETLNKDDNDIKVVNIGSK